MFGLQCPRPASKVRTASSLVDVTSFLAGATSLMFGAEGLLPAVCVFRFGHRPVLGDRPDSLADDRYYGDETSPQAFSSADGLDGS
jgi:hypothetical protein